LEEMPVENIQSSTVWDTSCLAELIYELLNRQFISRKCPKPVTIQYFHAGVTGVMGDIQHGLSHSNHFVPNKKSVPIIPQIICKWPRNFRDNRSLLAKDLWGCE